LEFKICFILQLLELLLQYPFVSAATGATSQQLASHCFSCWSYCFSAAAGPLLFMFFEVLSESPSTIAAVTKDKILSIDLEASSFDGITNSTSRGSELYQPLQKLECLILSFFYCDVFSFDIHYK
jgi:hypothetical protein